MTIESVVPPDCPNCEPPGELCVGRFRRLSNVYFDDTTNSKVITVTSSSEAEYLPSMVGLHVSLCCASE